MARRTSTQVEVEGRTLTLSNLEKVMYPATGFTKGQVVDFYRRIAPVLLPHLLEHPLTLKRYPDGAAGPFFYEKRCPAHRPDWVQTALIVSGRVGTVDFCLAQDLPTLVWAANLASLELHPSLSHRGEPTRPTVLVFDLDPGAPATVVECATVALELRDTLAHLGMRSWPKTSGSKGLQLYVPLNTDDVTYDGPGGTKALAKALAMLLERRIPELVVSDMKKSLREGRVLVDWSQNDEHKTTVSVYSLRAKERPTVSTPLHWEEVEAVAGGADPESVVFDAEAVLERVEREGDLFAPVLTLEQGLPRL